MEVAEVVADRFEIEAAAGSGSMGIVYRARDRETARVVALKVLRNVGHDAPARFAREGQLLAALRHPAIVEYVAHGTTFHGEAYIAMEWLEGEDLSARLARGSLTLRESVVLARVVAQGLGAAHAQGVVHRDIKPRNLFLPGGTASRVKILDFGVAKLTRSEGPKTATGILLGTVGYLAPEQATTSKDVDARADVFSLGCVLFKCLTGQVAFGGDDFTSVLAKVLFEDVAPLTRYVPNAPRALEDLLSRMLAKDPNGRPRDGAAVAAELDAIERLDLDAATPPLAPTSSAALTGSEQRLLSVVAVEVPNALAVGETATPESFDAAALDREELLATAAVFGARVELLGASVIAVLEGKSSATDRAAHAARCALAMRRAAPQFPVALATGRAELGAHRGLGEVIDRAVGLLRASSPAPARIRIDDVTAGLIDRRFEIARGPAWSELLEERAGARPTRLLLGKPTPCVGRDQEIASILRTFDQCIEDPRARAVLLTAPAGFGKSRIRYELVQRVHERSDGTRVLEGRGDPMHAGSPFVLLAPAVRRAAQIVDLEPIAVRRHKLEDFVAQRVPPGEVRRVSEFVGELASVPFDDATSLPLRAARRDAVVMGDQMRAAWTDLVSGMCRGGPVLLVLEDAHWGDAPSMAYVDWTLRELSERPFMVLAVGRPDLHEVFPRLWAARSPQEIRLGPLRRRAGEQLARAVLGDGVDPKTLGQILERADGNAFYLEELVRAVAEGNGERLPETVLAMAQARLDALEPDARRTLRAGSVYGNSFSQGGVQALVGEAERFDLPAWLATLADRELLTRRPASAFPGDVDYVFRNSLLRDAAYATLTERDRELGHKLAGDFLQARGEPDPVALAEHFERGRDLERAAAGWREAADRALDANDFTGAIERAERGVRCGASGETLGALRLVQAKGAFWSEDAGAALGRTRLAMSLLAEGTRGWFSAAGDVLICLARLGHKDELEWLTDTLLRANAAPDAVEEQIIALGRGSLSLQVLASYERAAALAARLEALARAGPAREASIEAWLHQVHGYQALYAGDAGGYVKHTEASVAGFERLGDHRAACTQRANLGDALIGVGMYREAEAALREALDRAERMGIAMTSSFGRLNLGLALAERGAHDEALAIELRGLEQVKLHRDPRLLGAAHAYLALLLLRTGDLGNAEAHARESVDSLREAPPRLPHALAVLARILLQRGDVEKAQAAVDEAVMLAGSLGQQEEGKSLVPLVHAEVLHAAGRREEASLAIRDARTGLLERAAKILDPGVRRSFLENVDDNARTLSLAAAWGGPN